MNDFGWRPFIPLGLMIVISIILIVIVILNRKCVINRILTIILLFIITQRPVLYNDFLNDTSLYDIIFVIDRSTSMNAVDVNNDTRLNAAKESISSIMNSFNDSYYTIITYDMYAEILYPLTKELDIIDDFIDDMDVVNPNFTAYAVYRILGYSYSSSFNVPYSELQRILVSEKRDEQVKRLVFFISDGEINSPSSKASDFSGYKSIADLIDDGAVLGYGTENGANIIIKQEIDKEYKDEYVDKNGYLKDGNDLAVSKYNEESLQSFADNVELEYVHVDDKSKIDDVIARMQQSDELKSREWKDIYYYFAFVLLILILIELGYSRKMS